MRVLHLTTGLVLYAIGIVITIKANIGYAPWDVFHVGLANTTGLTIGIISIIVGIIIVTLVTLLKEKFGIGTVLNIIFIGIFIDIIFLIDIIPVAHNTIAGIIMLIAGLFIISFGSFFYIRSGFGVGPRDNLMVVLARRTRLPVGICRFAIELVVTIIGWLLGGMVGIGTVVSVIAIGFCIQITFKLFKFDVTAVKHENVRDTLTAISKKIRKKQPTQEQFE